jgi:plasmid maintenance system antidote protein VapI
MEITKAFQLTIKKFGIKAVELSKASGVDQADVSRFVNDRTNCGHRTVDKLIRALPDTAKDYFWLLYKTESDVFDCDEGGDRRLSMCEKPAKYKADKKQDAIAV